MSLLISLAGCAQQKPQRQPAAPAEPFPSATPKAVVDVSRRIFPAVVRLDVAQEAYVEGKRTLRRSIVTRDRKDPNRYLILAFFDSYESAMENSNLPETNEFGQRQAALLDAPMVFTDLDVVDDRP